jgi:hypothetical protein
VAEFIAFEDGVEVNGETVLSVVAGMALFKDQALQILRQNGIDDVQPGRWYPQQAWLNAFRDIGKVIGPKTLFNIGHKIPENAIFPADIDTVDKALASIDVAYHVNHRHGEIGTYGYQSSGAREATMVCRNPYPCDFDRGIIEAMVTRYKPADSAGIQVEHGAAKSCRKHGAESCTYHVTW